jgi:hypothetical protein
LRQIELEKLNQEIHLEITRPMFGREKRTWLWDFSHAIPTEGGLIAAMAVFYVHANNKTKIVEGLSTHGPIHNKVSVANEAPGGAVARTLIPQIAGQVFGGTGSLFELGLRFNRLRETIYGPTKMTQSIMSISSNLRKVDNPSSSNRISAASNTIYTCGQVYNIAELLKQRIAEDKRHAHLKKEAMLPEQRIARTISTYDLLTSQLAH